MSYDLLVLAPKGQALAADERSALVSEVRRLKGAKGNEITGHGGKAKDLLISIAVQCDDDQLVVLWQSLTSWARERGVRVHDPQADRDINLDDPGTAPPSYGTLHLTAEGAPTLDDRIKALRKEILLPRGFRAKGKLNAVRQIDDVLQYVILEKGARLNSGKFHIDFWIRTHPPYEHQLLTGGTMELIPPEKRPRGDQTVRYDCSGKKPEAAIALARKHLTELILPFLDSLTTSDDLLAIAADDRYRKEWRLSMLKVEQMQQRFAWAKEASSR